MTKYNIKKVKGKKQIVWNPGRKRGLEEAKERIGDIEREVKLLLKNKKKIKVLEIGCGYGKVLLELRGLFGDRVELHGTNLEKRWDLKLIRRFALAHKMFHKKDVNKNLPKLHILDSGKKMRLKSSSFDLIYAQASVQYIHDKAKFLEEVNRLLTKNGKAIIELQEKKIDSDVNIVSTAYPIEYNTLFEIWNEGKKVDVLKYLKKFKNVRIKTAKKGWSVLHMTKGKRFSLGLELINSFNLNKLYKGWWGTKAVYRVK